MYEHNYSRMNEGGCVMFCLEEAIHNTFRGNVSYDDLGGTDQPFPEPGCLLEHNTFYRVTACLVRAATGWRQLHREGGSILPLP